MAVDEVTVNCKLETGLQLQHAIRKILQSVGNYLQVNTASYIRRPESLLRLLYRLSW
jgi:hypothetical protein